MIGIGTRRNDALTDWVCPVNWLAPLNRGLVGWWLCVPGAMGGSKWLDLCKRNDGTLTNMIPQTNWKSALERVGGLGSLQTNSTGNYVDFGPSVVPGGEVTLSISAWLYRAVSSTLVSVGRGVTNTRVGIARWSDGNVYFLIDTGAVQAYGSIADGGAGWKHFHLIYNGSGAANADRLKAEINGAPVTLTFSGTIPSSIPVSANTFRAGYMNSGSILGGIQDDIRVTRVISQNPYHASRMGYQAELRRMPKLTSLQVAAAGGSVGPLIGGRLNKGILIRGGRLVA